MSYSGPCCLLAWLLSSALIQILLISCYPVEPDRAVAIPDPGQAVAAVLVPALTQSILFERRSSSFHAALSLPRGPFHAPGFPLPRSVRQWTVS